jgi:CBS domain-containing protein
MNIREIMTQPAVTCRDDDTLNTAAQLMWEHDCGAIPVVGGDGRLVGIVTDRDICMASYTKGKPLYEISVGEAMASEPVACHPDEPLETAERLMAERQIRRVPIVDSAQRPLGLLSFNDIARAASAGKKKNGLGREVVDTLAAICKPRSRVAIARQRPEHSAMA